MLKSIAVVGITALLSSLAHAADTIGTLANGTVVMVAPTPTVLAFICSPTWKVDTCWPDTPGSSVTALVSSMAPTQHVWASIAGAAPRWVPLSLVTLLELPIAPTPNAPPTASSPASISWIWPTSNTDGSPITDLTGWNVYIRTASGVYSAPISLPLSTTNYVMPNTPGTYYIVVTAVSASNGEGRRSAEATVTIDQPKLLRCASSPASIVGMQVTVTTTCTYGN